MAPNSTPPGMMPAKASVMNTAIQPLADQGRADGAQPKMAARHFTLRRDMIMVMADSPGDRR